MSFSIKLVKNCVRNCAVARNCGQFTLRNCRFAPNGQLLLKVKKLFKTAHATVNLFKLAC